MGYKNFLRVLESESSYIITEYRFILNETAFNIGKHPFKRLIVKSWVSYEMFAWLNLRNL